MSEPTQPTSGATAETAADNFTAPGSFGQASNTPEAQVDRLHAFLLEEHPTELGLTNRQAPEATVDVAIRLLQGYAAHASAEVAPRCGEQYCNRPQGHVGDCAWVQQG